MAQIPDDQNNDDFMNASAEEWSKPEEPAPMPESKPEKTDRWGAVQPEAPDAPPTNRWGSEPVESARPAADLPEKKGKSKWWVILIIAAVLLCLCVCVVVFGLPMLGLNLLPANFLQ